MENSVDRRERTIFVSDMHRSVSEEVLYDLFMQAGPIEKVILKEDSDGIPQHALVVFKNVESVMWSIATLNGTNFGDQQINIRPLRESSHNAVLESTVSQMGNNGGSGPGSPIFTRPASPTFDNSFTRQTRSTTRTFSARNSGFGTCGTSQGMPRYSGPIGASMFGGTMPSPSSFYNSPSSMAGQYSTPPMAFRPGQQNTWSNRGSTYGSCPRNVNINQLMNYYK